MAFDLSANAPFSALGFIKNGKLVFDLTVDGKTVGSNPYPIGSALPNPELYCPNSNWTAAVTAPSDSCATSNPEPGGCPACQLQHNSIVDLPRVSEPFAA